MKIFRFVDAHQQTKPAVLMPNGKRLDVSHLVTDYNELFFANGGIDALRERLNTAADKCPEVPINSPFAPCVARPSKLVNIGLNYYGHIKEQDLPIPSEPVIFIKASTALSGAFDAVIIPRNSEKLDWECELAFVIGKEATYVSEADALEYIAGYTIQNDYSERGFQLGGHYTKAKSHNSFAPVGPYLVPKEEIDNPQNLKMWLSLNGQVMQSSNTSDMIFTIPKILSYLSQYMTLLPGDIVSTGSPCGSGVGLKPPRFLKEGDIVELGIEGLGCQKQQVVKQMVLV